MRDPFESGRGPSLGRLSEIHPGSDECLKLVCLALREPFVFISVTFGWIGEGDGDPQPRS